MSTPRPPSKPLDLDITIVSAKHLKNVNWLNGGVLKPYAIFWVDPDRRLATKSDDSGSTSPVWNERFTLPLTLPPHDSFLTLEIFHSKPSECPKPLVGSLRVALKDLVEPDDSTRIRTFDLRRPSGRPHGKVRIKLALVERPLAPAADYRIPPPLNYYYSAPRDYPPPPPPSPFIAPPAPSPPPPPQHTYPYASYSDPYTSYYSSGYYPPPPPPPRPFLERQHGYSGPSAPVDYMLNDQKPRSSGKMGSGMGLGVGAVAGTMGGLTLDEGLNRTEERVGNRLESDSASRDDYSEYHGNYGYNN